MVVKTGFTNITTRPLELDTEPVLRPHLPLSRPLLRPERLILPLLPDMTYSTLQRAGR